MTDTPKAVLLPGYIEPSRALAAAHVQVVAICQGRDAAVRQSRAVDALLHAPDTWDERFDRWYESALLPPGAPVLPTKDAAVWWLSQRGLGVVPPFRAVVDTLVKHRLYLRCLETGVAAPKTWLAEPGAALPDGPFPMVVKPQTRVGLRHWIRGRLVRNANELASALEWFRREVRYDPWITDAEPSLAHPIVQEYAVRPGRRVYHLAGYRSQDGEWVVSAKMKLLQYPLRFGSGLCFESADVDWELAAKLGRLLSGIGLHGIFEAEFVERDGEQLLIDLNPRCYNGISLEVRRGYNLPWYLYLEAIGERELLRAELAKATAMNAPPLAWRDGIKFWTMLAGQTLTGGMSPRAAAGWARWSWRQRKALVDPQFARGDLRAGFAALGEHVAQAVTDPRRLVGTYARRGLDR